MKKIWLLIFLLGIFLLPHGASGEIYTWVDENGVKHFGNEPPPLGTEAIGEQQEIPYDAARDRARQEADEKYWEDMGQMNRESETASAETNPPAERQPDLEGGRDVVYGSDPEREAIENRGERGTYADMTAPRGSYASEEGKPGTYDNMAAPPGSYASEEGKPGTYDNMAQPGEGGADRVAGAAGVVRSGRAQ